MQICIITDIENFIEIRMEALRALPWLTLVLQIWPGFLTTATVDNACWEWQHYSRMTSVSGVITFPRTDDDPNTFYFGDMGDNVTDCACACEAELNCASYTLYMTSFDDAWAGQCYGTSDAYIAWSSVLGSNAGAKTSCAGEESTCKTAVYGGTGGGQFSIQAPAGYYISGLQFCRSNHYEHLQHLGGVDVHFSDGSQVLQCQGRGSPYPMVSISLTTNNLLSVDIHYNPYYLDIIKAISIMQDTDRYGPYGYTDNVHTVTISGTHLIGVYGQIGAAVDGIGFHFETCGCEQSYTTSLTTTIPTTEPTTTIDRETTTSSLTTEATSATQSASEPQTTQLYTTLIEYSTTSHLTSFHRITTARRTTFDNIETTSSEVTTFIEGNTSCLIPSITVYDMTNIEVSRDLPDRLSSGSVIVYKCKQGFDFPDDTTRTAITQCQTSGVWLPRLRACFQEYAPDFEHLQVTEAEHAEVIAGLLFLFVLLEAIFIFILDILDIVKAVEKRNKNSINHDKLANNTNSMKKATLKQFRLYYVKS